MDIVLFIMLSYGLCFGLANKVPPLYSQAFREEAVTETFIDRLLNCAYCLGFHTGWMALGLLWLCKGAPALDWTVAPTVLVACFVSAAACYVADTALRWLEGNI